MNALIPWLAFAAFALPATPQAPQEEPAEGVRPAESPEAPFGFPLRGALSLHYRARWSGDDRDQDLYQVLTADAGDPDKRVWSAHMLLRAAADLDGDQDRVGFFAFDSIADTYDNRVTASLVYGYVELHRLGALESIRAGRLIAHETPFTFHWDGVQAETAPWEAAASLQGGLYGGLPVHPYESSPNGDAIAGAYARAVPWAGARARIDIARIRDDYRFGTQRNNLLGLHVSQRVGEPLLLDARYVLLDAESRDLSVRASYRERGSDLGIDVSYLRLFKTQRELALDVDLFFAAALETFPYEQLRLLASKGFGDHVLVQAGFTARELADDGREAPFNREFRHAHVTGILSDWLLTGLSVSVTGDVWEVPGSDNGDIRTGGFDLTHRCSERVKVSAGSSYALYAFDIFQNLERERVRVFYARTVWRPRLDLKIDVAWELEHDDLGDFRTLKVGVMRTF